MKKSILISSVAALFVAGWVGTSWYTGKILEKNKDEYTELANQQFPILIAALTGSLDYHPSTPIQLKLTDFERGLFSSKARYYLYETNTRNANKGIYIDTRIEHGPFPLSELSAFRFMPKAAAIHLQLEKNAQTEFLFMLTQQKPPFQLTVIPENKKIRAILHISPAELSGIKLEETKLNLFLDEKQKQLMVDGEIKGLAFDTPEISINMNGVTFDGTFYPGRFYQFSGRQVINFDRIDIQNHAQHSGREFNYKTINLNKLSLSNQIDEDTNIVHFKYGLKTEQLSIDNSDLGAINMNLAVNNLNGYAVKQLFKKGNEYKVPTLLNDLLSSSVEFKIDSFTWKNQSGTGQYSAKVLFNNPGDTNLQTLSQEDLIKVLVKELDSNLSLPLPMLKEFLATSLHLTKNVTKDDAYEQVTTVLPLISGYLKRIDKNKMLILNNDGLTSNLHYEDETVSVNGKKKSLDAFIEALEQ